MTTTPRTDLIDKIYGRTSAEKFNEAIASREQIEDCLDDAFCEIARWRWISAKGVITVEANSDLLILTPDWLIKNLANKDILRAISKGRDPRAPRQTNPPLQRNRNSYGFNTGAGFGFGSRFSPTSRSMIAPLAAPNPPDNTPDARSQLIDGVVTPVFDLPFVSPSAWEWEVRYNARYVVTDQDGDVPAVNTFPDEYLSILKKVVMVLIAGSRAFDLDIKNNSRDPLDTFAKQEEVIAKICSKIASRGRNR